jgi:hypothetical protein
MLTVPLPAAKPTTTGGRDKKLQMIFFIESPLRR